MDIVKDRILHRLRKCDIIVVFAGYFKITLALVSLYFKTAKPYPYLEIVFTKKLAKDNLVQTCQMRFRVSITLQKIFTESVFLRYACVTEYMFTK